MDDFFSIAVADDDDAFDGDFCRCGCYSGRFLRAGSGGKKAQLFTRSTQWSPALNDHHHFLIMILNVRYCAEPFPI